MFYAHNHDLDQTSDLDEARALAGLSIAACIDLCDISSRTWYRWCHDGAPRWATRLILSTRGTLDRFGWKDWEIRHGRLYYNQLSYRYYWDPVRLVVPLYGVKDPGIIFQDLSDKVSGIEEARELELVDNNREHKVLALSALKHNSA